MKKLLLVLVFAGISQKSFSQLEFGIKGGINYNSNSFQEVINDVIYGAEQKTGFHGGIWARFNIISAMDLYLRPEAVYTVLKTSSSYSADGNKANGTDVNYNFKKVDLPILFGTKFLNFLHVLAGPSVQYILNSEFDLNDLKEIKTDGFSLGIQLGAGVEIGQLGIDVRWERALSDTETEFVNNITNNSVNFDTRVNQIILSLSYKF